MLVTPRKYTIKSNTKDNLYKSLIKIIKVFLFPPLIITLALFLKIKIRVFGFGGELTKDDFIIHFGIRQGNTKDITVTTKFMTTMKLKSSSYAHIINETTT